MKLSKQSKNIIISMIVATTIAGSINPLFKTISSQKELQTRPATLTIDEQKTRNIILERQIKNYNLSDNDYKATIGYISEGIIIILALTSAEKLSKNSYNKSNDYGVIGKTINRSFH